MASERPGKVRRRRSPQLRHGHGQGQPRRDPRQEAQFGLDHRNGRLAPREAEHPGPVHQERGVVPAFAQQLCPSGGEARELPFDERLREGGADRHLRDPGVGHGHWLASSGSGPRCWVHDAEALPGWSFHHPPALDEPHPPRPQPFQAPRLRLQVVGLDVQVDATLVRDLLDEEQRLFRRGLQRAVTGLVGAEHLAAERPAPEAGRVVHVGGVCSRSRRCSGGCGAWRPPRARRVADAPLDGGPGRTYIQQIKRAVATSGSGGWYMDPIDS